jgi:hypothetical protein
MPTITLSSDEALVLFDLLAREIEDRNEKRIAEMIEHPAEFWAPNDVFGSLQRELVEPFDPNYRQLVAAARERIVGARDPDRTYVVGEV